MPPHFKPLLKTSDHTSRLAVEDLRQPLAGGVCDRVVAAGMVVAGLGRGRVGAGVLHLLPATRSQ